MIDLHSHILPALCDGSQNLETSLEMARIAVADGTTHLACTPHIYPGIYPNSTDTILPALHHLQAALDEHAIPLTLVIGADVHMVPEVMSGLRQGSIPTLHGSRYFLLEPSHHVAVPNFVEKVENFINAGYVPLITHPERLHWLEEHYAEFVAAAHSGAWIQITAGSINGEFGSRAKKWSERMLQDGIVHIIASDAHGIKQRRPAMSAGVIEAIRLTDDEAEISRMVQDRPQAVLDNRCPTTVAKPPGLAHPVVSTALLQHAAPPKRSLLQRLFA
ncbi:MAG: capsular biosynthesis protein [Thiothrix lacustris]|uniref:protein-tyrosine-phosphatase n=1 Tax=Thiothrix lacustris TaxID=525917 RepID=A0A1Y1QLT0_9GAMM|nr:MAG: capsular biosynthesis protein [Thiothrix lacustris]